MALSLGVEFMYFLDGFVLEFLGKLGALFGVGEGETHELLSTISGVFWADLAGLWPEDERGRRELEKPSHFGMSRRRNRRIPVGYRSGSRDP